MNWQPMNDRLVLRRVEEKQRGTIVIPDSAKDPSVLCEVVAVGPGKWIEGVNGHLVRAPLEVKPGEKVIIGPYTDLERDGLVLCQEADIRVVLR